MGQLGDKLKELRGDRSYYQVGQGSGVDRSHIKRYEANALRPTLDKLRKLANYYEVPFSELMFCYLEDEYPDPDVKAIITQWAKKQAKN